MTKFKPKDVCSLNQTDSQVRRYAPSLSVEQLISKLAQDETGKRQHYRPIYSLHKWWARRPGTLFRSIILMAVYPELRETLLKIDRHGNLEPSAPYFLDYNLDEWTILDPFMGGGTTLVEANRMGARVVGCDLNPVAYWIGRENLKVIDLERLDAYFHQISATAGAQIREFYRTRCIYCGGAVETLYVFWIRFIPCLRCGERVLLHKRCLLNEGVSRNRPLAPANPATVFCPQCLNLFQWGGHVPAKCPHCGNLFNPREGNYNQGYYRCGCSDEPISLLETIRNGMTLNELPVALEYWCDSCNARLYKSLDEDDHALRRRVEALFDERKSDLILPDTPIPIGTSSRRWIQHGYRRYCDLFNKRQLLAINILIEATKQIEDAEYRECFYTVLSNMLEYNNMMTPYNYPHRKLHHLFNYHALPLTTTPVESNVWGVGEEGAGTFVNCYQRYRKAKLYCQKPFERYKNRSGQVVTRYALKERIGAQFVQSFDSLKQTPRAALLLCGDSAKLDALPSDSVDLVITDPPYYDNVHYSELSNFFYVWLARLTNHPCFQSDLVPTEGEAVVNKGQGKGEEDYLRLLTAVLQECHRVLKAEGRLIFTFHHTNPRAWWTIFCAVRQSGFRVVDFFPVQSEYRVNPHIRAKQALDMDLVLICQKQSLPYTILSHAPADCLERAQQIVGQYVHNGSRNLLYLHFVGELLRSASCSGADWTPSAEWLLSALQVFEGFTLSDRAAASVGALQLLLFERPGGYNDPSE
ncbi:MAG: DNA methylase [Fimbriimonadales bacterium]|nr:MAG: DNA methylase [Fimbriimonadales bacterium]